MTDTCDKSWYNLKQHSYYFYHYHYRARYAITSRPEKNLYCQKKIGCSVTLPFGLKKKFFFYNCFSITLFGYSIYFSHWYIFLLNLIFFVYSAMTIVQQALTERTAALFAHVRMTPLAIQSQVNASASQDG